MADATNLQVSFLGGEIAPSFQGRADSEKYKTGLGTCSNSMPLETGAWARRPGTRVAAPTRGGKFAKIIGFDFSQSAPYTAEFTDAHVRFFSNYSLVHTYDPRNVLSISTASPAVVTVNGSSGWANGDMVEFFFEEENLDPEEGVLLVGRQFLIGSVSGANFSLFDSITGADIDGSTLNFTAGTPCVVQRVLDIATPYSEAMLPTLRGIQALNGNTNTLVLLQEKTPPQTITSTIPPEPVFALSAASFKDGPYLDPVSDGTTVTPSAVSGTITLTASTAKFTATDVGRHVRLFSQPAAWASATVYAEGALVSYNDAFYTSLVSGNTGKVPGTDATNWGVAVNATAWVWGIITAYTSTTVVTVALQVVNTPTLQLPGVLVNTNAIKIWRLGAFSRTTGYPTCGTYTEGRLFLSGVIRNRFDASVSNDIFNFSPTAVDGTVSDSNAISYTFNAKDLNTIFWMTPIQSGVLCGTQAAEWLIQASSNGDILTPTSCQAKRVSKYGCSNIEPVEAPFATLFVARNNKKVFEYLSDTFSTKHGGINVSLTGSHLTAPGVAEIRYQRELTPVVWVRMDDGSLAGMTYRRESPTLSEQASFAGWHRHNLGTGRTVSGISIGPSVGGNLDTLTLVTYDSDADLYYIELLTDLFPDDGENTDAWFVDGGTTPAGSLLTGFGAGATNLRLFGLSLFEGKTVSAYIAGVDAGDFTVANGVIDIALPAGNNNSGLLTGASIAALSDLDDFSPTAMPVTYATQNFPAFPQSIQAYIGPTTPVTGASANTVLIDAKRMRLFVFSDGTASTDGIRVFDIMSGLQIAQATRDQIYGGASSGSIVEPYTLGDDGFIYMTTAASNSTTFLKIDPDSLKVVGKAGIASGSLTASPTSIRYPYSIAAVSIGGRQFLVAPSLVGATVGVVETSAGSMQLAGHYVSSFVDSRLTAVAGRRGTGIAYMVGWGSPSGTYTDGYKIYRTVIGPSASGFDLSNFPTTQNPAITTSLVATISPASIDATWTHVAQAYSIHYDNSDGNLIIIARTADAVTEQKYAVKVNLSTGAVLWKTAIDTPYLDTTMSGSSSYLAFGSFAFIGVTGGPTYRYNSIDTTTGARTTTTLSGLTTFSDACVWDSRLGAVFGFGSFTAGGGAPTPLNTTPSSFGGWFALRLTSGATPATGRQYYIVPAAVGTTFTSRGQRLRPLEPADTGARNGPALGKTRRNHETSFLLLNSAGLKFGTTFSKLKTVLLRSAGGTPYLDNQLYSGIFADTVTDDYSYDGAIAWEASRPYPATVLANSGFLQTQDK